MRSRALGSLWFLRRRRRRRFGHAATTATVTTARLKSTQTHARTHTNASNNIGVPRYNYPRHYNGNMTFQHVIYNNNNNSKPTSGYGVLRAYWLTSSSDVNQSGPHALMRRDNGFLCLAFRRQRATTRCGEGEKRNVRTRETAPGRRNNMVVTGKLKASLIIIPCAGLNKRRFRPVHRDRRRRTRRLYSGYRRRRSGRPCGRRTRRADDYDDGAATVWTWLFRTRRVDAFLEHDCYRGPVVIVCAHCKQMTWTFSPTFRSFCYFHSCPPLVVHGRQFREKVRRAGSHEYELSSVHGRITPKNLSARLPGPEPTCFRVFGRRRSAFYGRTVRVLRPRSLYFSIYCVAFEKKHPETVLRPPWRACALLIVADGVDYTNGCWYLCSTDTLYGSDTYSECTVFLDPSIRWYTRLDSYVSSLNPFVWQAPDFVTTVRRAYANSSNWNPTPPGSTDS